MIPGDARTGLGCRVSGVLTRYRSTLAPMPMYGTPVSKTHPAIKKILAATVLQRLPGWKGRTIEIDQVKPSWHYTLHNDTGEPYVYTVENIGGGHLNARQVQKPAYGEAGIQIGVPHSGEAIVTQQIGRTGSVRIYIPALDQALLDVARDALLEEDKKRAAEVLKQLAPYDGIASAIIESQKTTLAKSTGGTKSPQTARRLEREIGAFLDREHLRRR